MSCNNRLPFQRTTSASSSTNEIDPICSQSEERGSRRLLLDKGVLHIIAVPVAWLISLGITIVTFVWATKTLNAAVMANEIALESLQQVRAQVQQAQITNQISLMTLCQSDQKFLGNETCTFLAAQLSVANIVTMFGVQSSGRPATPGHLGLASSSCGVLGKRANGTRNPWKYYSAWKERHDEL